MQKVLRVSVPDSPWNETAISTAVQIIPKRFVQCTVKRNFMCPVNKITCHTFPLERAHNWHLPILRDSSQFLCFYSCGLGHMPFCCLYWFPLSVSVTGPVLVKKFPAFYGTRSSITAFTSARHLSLSWARVIQSMPPHSTSWRSILILSYHLRLGLPRGLLVA